MSTDINQQSFEDLCFYCLGHGKLKTIQMSVTLNGKTIRTDDTVIECNRCNGTGRSK